MADLTNRWIVDAFRDFCEAAKVNGMTVRWGEVYVAGLKFNDRIELGPSVLQVKAADPATLETPLARFERRAEEFHHATGMLAPGKDSAAADNSHTYEERRAAWDKWNAEQTNG